MKQTMTRFYKTATPVPTDKGFAVNLDARPIRTPHCRTPLVVPSKALADAITAEWNAQEDTIDPHSMPLTALANTALDLDERRADLEETLAQCTETDLLCHWAPGPEELTRRQQTLWQPLLDWVALSYDARLNTTTGILPAPQPPDACHALTDAVRGHDRFRLAALSSAVAATNSVVIGLAVLTQRVDAETAFEATEVEATYEIQQWGADADATKRRQRVHDDLMAVERFLTALDKT